MSLLVLLSAPALHAEFIVSYTDAAGTGFYDATYGTSRRQAFEWAANQWNLWLGGTDPVAIRISAGWASLGAGILGGSESAQSVWRDFSGTGVVPNTWYGDSLADSLHGSDLGGGSWDMMLTFNTDFTTWNYNYTLADGGFPGLYDFASVSMHEIGHGLGLWQSVNSSGAWGFGTGYPTIYDRFLEYANGTDLIATNPAPDVTKNPGGGGAADNGIFWSGSNATLADGGNRVEIYAPGTWSDGSSLSHIDQTAHPGLMMNYAIGTNDERRTIDPLAQGMLRDIGWQGDNANIPEPTTLALMVPGVVMLVLRRRRKTARPAAPEAD